jgi:hypothetical protein
VIRDQIEALKGGREGLKKYRSGGKDAQHKKRGPRSGTIYKADKFTVGKKTRRK